MPDLTESFNSTLLPGVMKFVGESGSLEQYKALSVWRSLSLTNQAIGNGELQAQRTANFSFCANLTDEAAQHLARCPQLRTVSFPYCLYLTDAAAQHLARCPQLQTVNFAFCKNLTDAAAQHLTQRHPHISVLM